ncbi:MAG: ABC transporter substrate-binding protein [bacterium]|nr:ABC transporter substrate-binding protein [bacterium]
MYSLKKKHIARSLISVFAVITALIVSQEYSYSQTATTFSSQADSLFEISIDLYNSNDLDGSKSILEDILDMQKNQRSSAAHFLLTRIYLDKNDLINAQVFTDRFFKEHPYSRYVNNVRLIRSELYYNKGFHSLALNDLCTIINISNDQALLATAVEKTVNIFNPGISEHIYNEFQTRYDSQTVKYLLDLKKVQLHVFNKEFEKGVDILNTIQGRLDYDSFRDEVSRLLGIFNEDLGGDKYIAFLFPFRGEHSETGLRIHKGAQFALQEYNKYSETNIKIKPVDTEADPLKIPSLLRQLSNDPSIIAVVGPITRDAQIIAISLAPEYKIPLILPMNHDDLEFSGNDYIINLMSNAELEGKTIARLAVEELGLKNFGILSPIGSKEEKMANSFALEIEDLGGNVLVHEWYFPGTLDYKPQFTNIRKIGYNLQMTDSLRIYLEQSRGDTLLADSLLQITGVVDNIDVEVEDTLESQSADTLADIFYQDSLDIGLLDSTFQDTLIQDALDSLTVYQLDSLWRIYQDTLDTRRKKAGIRRFDSLDYPVFTYDALYIPLTDPMDMDFIVNQFAFHNLEAILLGNSFWYDLEMLERVDRNIRDLYFTSDYFLDDFYEPWGKFRDSFRADVGGSPGTYEIYGYDAMQLVFKAATSYLLTKEKFWESLSEIRDVTLSPRGALKFNDRHWKSNWTIIRYYRGSFRLVEQEEKR